MTKGVDYVSNGISRSFIGLITIFDNLKHRYLVSLILAIGDFLAIVWCLIYTGSMMEEQVVESAVGTYGILTNSCFVHGCSSVLSRSAIIVVGFGGRGSVKGVVVTRGEVRCIVAIYRGRATHFRVFKVKIYYILSICTCFKAFIDVIFVVGGKIYQNRLTS